LLDGGTGRGWDLMVKQGEEDAGYFEPSGYVFRAGLARTEVLADCQYALPPGGESGPEREGYQCQRD
jgi:hypothetical protein